VIQDTSSASELDGPDVNSEDRENPLPSRNLFTKFLVIPKPSLEQKKQKPARVLTSQENLLILRERKGEKRAGRFEKEKEETEKKAKEIIRKEREN